MVVVTPLGAFRAFLLQRTRQFEIAPLDRFPLFLAHKLIIRRDRRAIDAQVHADDLIRSFNRGCGNAHDHVQPPATIAVDQVCRIDGIAGILRRIVLNGEADRLPPADQREAHGATLPIQPIGMQVVARWASLRARHADGALWVAPKGKGASERFGGFCTSGIGEIAIEGWQRVTHGVVGQKMQPGRIRDSFLPAQFDKLVEGRGKLAAGFFESISLGGRWPQL